MIKETIFEKIVSREIPAYIFYEDNLNIAFLNINPFDKGHALVIPKKAYKTIFEMPEEEYLSLQRAVQKVAIKMRGETGTDIAIYQRNGQGAGQEVPHVHVHILPRYETEETKPVFNDNHQGSLDLSGDEMELVRKSFKF